MKKLLFMLLPFILGANETVGYVSTSFKVFGPNSKIVVDAFDDPSVQGVSCYISHPKQGGITQVIGMSEETSDASVACRQVGSIVFKNTIPKQEAVFKQSTSILFKKTQVIRMVDTKRNTLVYLVYSDKLVDGSPKNSVTAVNVPLSIKIPVK